MKRNLLFLLAILPLALFGQKKPLSHSDYDMWKSLGSSVITDDGKWVSYQINPQQGDGWLYLYNYGSHGLDSVARGINASFSGDASLFAYLVKPTYAETRQAKVDKKRPDDMPKNNLGIKNTKTGETITVERVKSFGVSSDEGSWIAYLMEKPLPPKEEKSDSGNSGQGREPAASGGARQGRGGRAPAGGNGGGSRAEGTDLVIANPVKGVELTVKDVTDYAVSPNGAAVAYVQMTTDTTKTEHYSVSVYDTKTGNTTEKFAGDGSLNKLTLFDKGDRLAFLFTGDTSKVKVYDLYYAASGDAEKIVSMDTPGMHGGWSVSENGTIQFSDNGSKIFFGTAAKPVEEPEDTLLADEKYSLDVWNWQDQLLQPQQKINLSREKRRTYQAVYHVADKKMVQLADEEMPDVRLLMKRDGAVAIGSSGLKYEMLSSWDANNYTDYYLVDVMTGKHTLLIEKAPSTVTFSPTGKYMMYWAIDSKSWKVRPVAGGNDLDLTASLGVDFFDELNDTPSEPRAYGVAEWIEGERYVLVYDRYDIWKLDVTGKDAAVNLTNGFGRRNRITLRYNSLSARGGGFRGRGGFGGGDEKLWLGPKEVIHLDAFNEISKQAGLYTIAVNKPADPVKIAMGDYALRSVQKPDDANVLMFQKGDFVHSPELYMSDMKMGNEVRISNTNPQQSQYNWGTVELVEWMSFDGQKLQGLLYKPEDFDPSKKYPMIAYFYERSSDELHSYIAPAPSASIINKTYAVSNGYLIFVPDIPYVEGYPGQSCYNAVVSGVYAMLDQFDFIDPERLGLDGQSWGGYQIAYLITQTDMFRCAFAGAPVSNMTSAYGGIRWGSGMSRMFQYEQTQSRIGGTLWERPMQYIENSPIFWVPKVNTPVMIMHNDADGAVPWYQGIEFFVALRRLGKPAWMVSYNDEDHNLVRRPDRVDLSIRKMQFFDHFLMGAPMPYWMDKGISQMEKGKISGYELMK